jgi:hypothetical protein
MRLGPAKGWQETEPIVHVSWKRGFAMISTVKITMLLYLVSVALVANALKGFAFPN